MQKKLNECDIWCWNITPKAHPARYADVDTFDLAESLSRMIEILTQSRELNQRPYRNGTLRIWLHRYEKLPPEDGLPGRVLLLFYLADRESAPQSLINDLTGDMSDNEHALDKVNGLSVTAMLGLDPDSDGDYPFLVERVPHFPRSTLQPYLKYLIKLGSKRARTTRQEADRMPDEWLIPTITGKGRAIPHEHLIHGATVSKTVPATMGTRDVEITSEVGLRFVRKNRSIGKADAIREMFRKYDAKQFTGGKVYFENATGRMQKASIALSADPLEALLVQRETLKKLEPSLHSMCRDFHPQIVSELDKIYRYHYIL